MIVKNVTSVSRMYQLVIGRPVPNVQCMAFAMPIHVILKILKIQIFMDLITLVLFITQIQKSITGPTTLPSLGSSIKYHIRTVILLVLTRFKMKNKCLLVNPHVLQNLSLSQFLLKVVMH